MQYISYKAEILQASFDTIDTIGRERYKLMKRNGII